MLAPPAMGSARQTAHAASVYFDMFVFDEPQQGCTDEMMNQ